MGGKSFTHGANVSNRTVNNGMAMGGGNKKIKIDQSEFRLQCCINCGANIVVENVSGF